MRAANLPPPFLHLSFFSEERRRQKRPFLFKSYCNRRDKIGALETLSGKIELVVIPGRLQSPGTWHFSRLGTSTSPSSIDQPSCFLWLASKISRDCSWPGLVPKKSLPFIPTPTFTLFVRTKNSHIKQHFFAFVLLHISRETSSMYNL